MLQGGGCEVGGEWVVRYKWGREVDSDCVRVEEDE